MIDTTETDSLVSVVGLLAYVYTLWLVQKRRPIILSVYYLFTEKKQNRLCRHFIQLVNNLKT